MLSIGTMETLNKGDAIAIHKWTTRNRTVRTTSSLPQYHSTCCRCITEKHCCSMRLMKCSHYYLLIGGVHSFPRSTALPLTKVESIMAYHSYSFFLPNIDRRSVAFSVEFPQSAPFHSFWSSRKSHSPQTPTVFLSHVLSRIVLSRPHSIAIRNYKSVWSC